MDHLCWVQTGFTLTMKTKHRTRDLKLMDENIFIALIVSDSIPVTHDFVTMQLQFSFLKAIHIFWISLNCLTKHPSLSICLILILGL